MKMSKIQVLIIDDDPVCLRQSKEKIKLYVPENQICQASNSVEIMRAFQERQIDLAFVDVEMPDTDGFTVVDYIREHSPKTRCVFLTGHAEFGAKSYDYEPLDFLCKPVDAMRLQKTFERYERAVNPGQPSGEKIAIEGASGFVMISPEEISYVTREGRKSVIYCGSDRYVAKDTLDQLELVLSDYDIIRCHQSYLIPIRKIKNVMQADFGRTYQALLETGDKIPVSRGKYPLVRDAIEANAKFV